MRADNFIADSVESDDAWSNASSWEALHRKIHGDIERAEKTIQADDLSEAMEGALLHHHDVEVTVQPDVSSGLRSNKMIR